MRAARRERQLHKYLLRSAPYWSTGSEAAGTTQTMTRAGAANTGAPVLLLCTARPKRACVEDTEEQTHLQIPFKYSQDSVKGHFRNRRESKTLLTLKINICERKLVNSGSRPRKAVHKFSVSFTVDHIAKGNTLNRSRTAVCASV